MDDLTVNQAESELKQVLKEHKRAYKRFLNAFDGNDPFEKLSALAEVWLYRSVYYRTKLELKEDRYNNYYLN